MKIISLKDKTGLICRTISSYPHTHGLSYVVAWAHRISGVFLVLYLVLHVFTLSTLNNPELFTAKMDRFSGSFFTLAEWLLAVPVIYHSMNGARLLWFEIYGTRQDKILIKWSFFFSALYLILMGVFIISGNQEVSALFFWLQVFTAGLVITYLTGIRLKKSGVSNFWKTHRLTSAFLILMVPAHMLYMHLNPIVGRNPQIILERLDNPFIKLVDLTLLICLLYHAAYGINGIINDYLKFSKARLCCFIFLIVISLYVGWKGLILTLSV